MNHVAPLTKRQRELYEFLGKFIRVHGFAPSLHEIAAAFQLLAISTVHKHLEQLRLKGYIRRYWNRSRSIELIAETGCCPMCGRALEENSEGAKVPLETGRKSDTLGSVVDVSASTTPTTTEVP